MESVLDRGEKLDDLVSKSEELSLQAKGFYTTVCAVLLTCEWVFGLGSFCWVIKRLHLESSNCHQILATVLSVVSRKTGLRSVSSLSGKLNRTIC